MPLGAPIGSGLGLQNTYNIREILDNLKVPIIVDAGVLQHLMRPLLWSSVATVF